MPYHFFPMIARMRYISRWGLMRNTDPENVQEHSHMVAVLAHALAVIENERFSGQTDRAWWRWRPCITTPVRSLPAICPPHQVRQPDIQTAYKAVEAVAEQKLLSMLPRPTPRL